MTAPADERAPQAPTRSYCPTCRAVFRGAFRRCPSDGAVLVPSDVDPMIGSVLADRYQIEAVIGDGGLGRVYRARHVRMSRRFAVKVPFGEVGYDRKARARLANEAEAASRLSHPNVIGVVDVGETAEGLFYLAMDLADGPSLGDVVARGRVATSDALTLLAQLADGLAHAHERGLVHRDLKPDNIVVTLGPDGGLVPRVIDFGLALLDEPGDGERLTTAGLVVGTPCYMAPEQATGGVLDHRTDLFALGIMLFEMLAGCLPFDGSPIEIARQNVEARLPTLLARSGRPVDPLLEAMVAWLTRRRRDDRPADTRVIATFARKLLARDRDGAAALLPPALRPAGAAAAAVRPTPPSSRAIVPDAAVLAALSSAPTDTSEAIATDIVMEPVAAVQPSSPAAEAAVAPMPSSAGARRVASTTLRPVVRTTDATRATIVPTRRWPWALALVMVAAMMIVMLAQRGRAHGPKATAPSIETAATDRSTTAPAATAPAASVSSAIPIAPAPSPRVGATTSAPRPRVSGAPAPTRPSAPAAVRSSTPPALASPVPASPAPSTATASPRPAPAPTPAPRVTPAPARVAAVPARAPISLAGLSLKAQYRRVAAELDAVVSRLGNARTAALRRRFEEIPPYLDAVRKPALRAAAEAQLASLARELDKLPL